MDNSRGRDEYEFLRQEVEFLYKELELERAKHKETELDAKKEEEPKKSNSEIGVIIYSYKCTKTEDTYCIYTYDPIYDDFVDKICDAYEENRETTSDEKLIGNKIVFKSEMDTIKWILNGISHYAVDTNELNGLFVSIDPKGDEVNWFNYTELLATDDEKASMLGLDEKIMDDCRLGYTVE